MMSAVPNVWADSHVVALICLATNIRSTTVTRATSAVPFSSSTSRLAAGGSRIGNVCGMMIRRMRWLGDMFSAIAASHWGRGTAWMAPRTTSAP